MHPSTLFLLPLLAGIIASPAHVRSWRTRRDENARAEDTATLVQQKQDKSELPPLPLEYEEEDEIYMSIDDPRVGTVDADGNVLVPVDDDGNILPGYEHLVQPVQIQMDVAQAAKQNVGQNSSIAAETLQPAAKVEETEKSSDFEDTTYDEAESNDDVSRLPAANDYVDSREAETDSKVVGEGVKAGLPSGGQDSEAVDENDIRPDVEAMEAEKKIEETIDAIMSPSEEELEQENMRIGQGAARESAGEDDSGKAKQGQPVEDSNAGAEEATNDEESEEDEEEEAKVRSPLDALVSEPVDDGEDASDPDGQLSPQDVDKAIDEVIRILPVDKKYDEEFDSDNFFDDVRKSDVLGSDTFKPKPDSAPISATTSALLITFVLSLWMA